MAGVARASVVFHRNEVNKTTVIRARAPLRISFLGGGTDLPHYYEQHGGAVLSSTISRYAFATLRPRSDDEILINALDTGFRTQYRIGQEPDGDNGAFALVNAAITRMGAHAGFELDLCCDAPRGSGLGGSSAVTAAVLAGMCEYLGVVISAYDLAELNFTIERVDLGVSGGKQDQYATTFGGFNLIEFEKDRVDVTPLRIQPEVLHDLEAHLMLCYTGRVRPGLGIVDKRVEAYNRGDKTVLDGMRHLHEMVYQAKDALLKGRLREFGGLLDAGMTMKQIINPGSTTPEIEELYDIGKRSGAIGGKLLGAGGGGYLLLMVEGRRRYEVRANLERAGGVVTDFTFAESGVRAWRSLYF